MKLETWGWDAHYAAHFEHYQEEGFSAGRVIAEHKNSYLVCTEQGEMPARLTGKMLYDALARADLPVVGDWVVLRILDGSDPQAVVHAVLPRKSKLSRKEAGRRTDEQPVAANVDTVFLMTGLDGNYNVRRIERALTLAREGGAAPVILLSKADLCPDYDERLAAVAAITAGAPVHAISVPQQHGLETLAAYLLPGRTLALLGSSGVGKSTLTNYLLGRDAQQVQEVRRFQEKGKHTTTHREIFTLPSGALLIDTPGMRELQLWGEGEGLTETFADIEELARQCRFSDCRHKQEPGCRVREALRHGELDPGRYENYQKMQQELNNLAFRQEQSLAFTNKRERIRFMKTFSRMPKR